MSFVRAGMLIALTGCGRLDFDELVDTPQLFDEPTILFMDGFDSPTLQWQTQASASATSVAPTATLSPALSAPKALMSTVTQNGDQSLAMRSFKSESVNGTLAVRVWVFISPDLLAPHTNILALAATSQADANVVGAATSASAVVLFENENNHGLSISNP